MWKWDKYAQTSVLFKKLENLFESLLGAIQQFETRSVTKEWKLLTNSNIESTTPESSIIQVAQDLS